MTEDQEPEEAQTIRPGVVLWDWREKRFCRLIAAGAHGITSTFDVHYLSKRGNVEESATLSQQMFDHQLCPTYDLTTTEISRLARAGWNTFKILGRGDNVSI
jgi:hypothetical protein